MHFLKQFFVDGVYAGFAVPFDFEFAGFDVCAHFECVVAVDGECVVVEGELAFAVFVVEHFHFVDDFFGAAYSVSSAEHAYGAAEVAPLHASAAGDEWEDGFAHAVE